MKLVMSRNNEPWALSAAAATATTTTAAAVLLLLLAQTSRTSAVGMQKKQEEQQQLPPSALPAARSGGEETTPRGLGRDERQLDELETCTTISIEGSDGTDGDGDYVDIGWTSVDRPVFFSYQSAARDFILVYADGLGSSSSYDDDYDYDYSFSSTFYSTGSSHTVIGSYSHGPYHYNNSAHSFYDDDWWNSHEETGEAYDDTDNDGEEEDGGGDYPTRRGLAGEGGPNAEIGEKKPSHRDGLPWHKNSKEGIQQSVVSALSLASKSRKGTTAVETTSETIPLLECVWILLPLAIDDDTSPYPIHFTLDCAEHPADISSFWFSVDEDSDMDIAGGMSELEEVEHMELSGISFAHVDLSITCAADVIDHDEDAGYTGECVDLGASGCTSREECCSANYLTVEEWCRNGVCRYETASLSCWDQRCCNKTGRICEKDKHCCDGLSCMGGFCDKPTKGCLELGLPGCASSTDCCSDYFADTLATCRKGRCCYKAGGGCQKDAECCKGYICDDDTSKCKRTY